MDRNNASSIIDNPTTKANYKSLIQHILRNTNYNIMLIPHVVQRFNDDLAFLKELYIDNGRMKLVDDCNCMQLKGYISKCKMIVCARTHCSIASYSMNIPTLVLGYSIKSKGIAKDIFGTYKNYVLPIDELKSNDDLTNGFKWLSDNYVNIKEHLEEFMPSYINKCYELRVYMKTYAVKNKDNEIRLKSSSGGVFTALAESIIDMGGIVIGAGWNGLNVEHIAIDDKDDCQN